MIDSFPAQDHRKLTFLYLANDVVQVSRKKGGEFGKSFSLILKKTFEHMARLPSEKTKNSILRILKIWEDRTIYEVNTIRDFESSYRKAWNDLHGSDFQELLEEVGDKSPAETSTSKSKGKKENEKMVFGKRDYLSRRILRVFIQQKRKTGSINILIQKVAKLHTRGQERRKKNWKQPFANEVWKLQIQ